MRAIHCTRYGPPAVLQLREVPRPAPKRGQVLIRVHAATVTMGDCELRSFSLPGWIWLPARLGFGITRPRQPVLGMELAGEVVEVGSDVTRFSVGDRVFGSTGFGMGAYADFKAMRASGSLTTIPDGVGYGEAAGIPVGGFNALQFIRGCALKPGERILINGAGGSIGSFAIQLARLAGAEVTAVDRGDKLDFMKQLGASEVIDYQTTDYWTSGRRYHAIIDVVGKGPFRPTVAMLEDGGRYYLGNPQAGQVLNAVRENRKKRVRVLSRLAGERVEDLDYLKGLLADGKLRVPIDRWFPLEQVAEAHAYVEAGNKRGVVVIDNAGPGAERDR